VFVFLFFVRLDKGEYIAFLIKKFSLGAVEKHAGTVHSVKIEKRTSLMCPQKDLLPNLRLIHDSLS